MMRLSKEQEGKLSIKIVVKYDLNCCSGFLILAKKNLLICKISNYLSMRMI